MTKECIVLTNESNIKFEECGRKVIFENVAREDFTKYHIDKCLIDNVEICDKAIGKDKFGEVFIELKGSDVDHACKQIKSGMQFFNQNSISNGKKAGLIICSKYPKFDTKIQKAKQQIARDFKAPLHVVCDKATVKFERIFEFQDPLRRK